MPDRLLPRVSATVLSLLAAGAASVVLGVWAPVLAVAAAISAAHLVTVPGLSERPTPLTMGAVAAAALMTTLDPVIIGLALVAGLPPGWWILAIAKGSRTADEIVAAQSAGAAVFLGVSLCLESLLGHPGAIQEYAHLLIVAGAAVGWFLADAGIQAQLPGARHRISGRLRWRRALRDWSVAVSILATGSMFAVAAPVMGAWAAAIAGVPYGFAHLGFVRLARTRNTYSETIVAMGAIPEAAGHAPLGRALSTSDLAVAVAAECGLGATVVDRVEQAALLHDIGTVVLANPAMVGGAYSPSDVAAWSAAIVGESPRLAPVASLVLASPLPYRRAGEDRDPDLPAGAHVVKVAAAFGRFVEEGVGSLDALERLHGGASYDFDPDVVHALRSVLVRRGRLGR